MNSVRIFWVSLYCLMYNVESVDICNRVFCSIGIGIWSSLYFCLYITLMFMKHVDVIMEEITYNFSTNFNMMQQYTVLRTTIYIVTA
jgi:hypothetical protein